MRVGEWQEYGPAKEFCGGASSSAEQFCQIAFDCVHAICQGAYYTRALFTESMSVGTLQGSCVAYLLVCQWLVGWEAYEAAWGAQSLFLCEPSMHLIFGGDLKRLTPCGSKLTTILPPFPPPPRSLQFEDNIHHF